MELLVTHTMISFQNVSSYTILQLHKVLDSIFSKAAKHRSDKESKTKPQQDNWENDVFRMEKKTPMGGMMADP